MWPSYHSPHQHRPLSGASDHFYPGGGMGRDRKEGSAVGHLKSSEVAGVGAGGSPFLMSKKRAFAEVSGQGGAINFYQGPVLAQASAVQSRGNQFFAGSRFTKEQNFRVAAGNVILALKLIIEKSRQNIFGPQKGAMA